MNRTFLFMMVLLSASFAQPYLLVIDASGSMDEYTYSDDFEGTRMDAAKSAAKSFVDSTSSEVGLVVFDECDSYGDIYSGNIYLAQDFTTDKATLNNKIDSLQPYGSTPIADALVEAKQYILDSRGSGTIVLITDGEETCGGDPVLEAGNIYSNGIGTVHVVGFLLTEEAESEAQEIAQAGGGQYYSVQNVDELESALTQISYGDSFCCAPAALLFVLPLLAFYSRR